MPVFMPRVPVSRRIPKAVVESRSVSRWFGRPSADCRMDLRTSSAWNAPRCCLPGFTSIQSRVSRQRASRKLRESTGRNRRSATQPCSDATGKRRYSRRRVRTRFVTGALLPPVFPNRIEPGDARSERHVSPTRFMSLPKAPQGHAQRSHISEHRECVILHVSAWLKKDNDRDDKGR